MLNLFNFLRNIVSLLTSSVAARGASLVLYALVSRYLGAHTFGQLMLAMTWLYLGQVFAVAGMRTLVTRELSKDKSRTWHYFAYANAIVLCCSMVAFAGVVVGTWLMGYSAESTLVIVLVAISLLPYALGQVCEAVFQAWEEMQLIAIANVIGNVFKICVAFVLLHGGATLLPLICLLICSQAVVLLTDWYLLGRYIRPKANELKPNESREHVAFRSEKVRTPSRGGALPPVWRWSETKSIFRATLPFLGIQSAIAIRSSLGILVLSKFANETQVGLYGAAMLLLVPLALVMDNIVEAVFPIMCRKSGESSILRETSERMTELLLSFALPVAVILFIAADDLLLLVYGNRDFIEAAVILRILACVPLLRSFTHVFGQVLWASQHENASLRITIITAVVNLLATIVLIQYFQLVGVAWAALLTVCIGLLLHYVPTATILKGVDLRAATAKPLAAAVVMVGIVMLFQNQHPYIVMPFAPLGYLASLSLIVIVSAGGMQQVKKKYISIVSD